MEIDLDALQQLPAEEEQATECRWSCCTSCPFTCNASAI
ncbi:ALQxL family class IV lanthipeptide [Kitasatospora sp. NPDC004240]